MRRCYIVIVRPGPLQWPAEAAAGAGRYQAVLCCLLDNWSPRGQLTLHHPPLAAGDIGPSAHIETFAGDQEQ